MIRPIVLSVGESVHLRRGKDHIFYAGMPSENVYSIVQRKAAGYQGYAWSLFFPKKQQEITVDGVSIFVENVTPQAITLRIG
ncbi:MAG TPA: hypothetical protein G4N91_01235 [Dehalococcoidia bacterium]|nr:hypothetical protein [Dehalococcoidia bacterium]